ncbi:MAG: ATP-binding domain-containing protein, partial [Pseudonocardiaceae bacterium]
ADSSVNLWSGLNPRQDETTSAGDAPPVSATRERRARGIRIFGELDELTHAYALSLHRSQGSEYPCVVIPITTSAWMMLQRNLLYTAITRAKKLVVLVGSTKAIGQAVRTIGAGRRHTTLDYRLNQP